MAKLETLSLDELYSKKVTSTVEKVILLKEDFFGQAPRWCEKVCKLNCKNPPPDIALVPTDKVDILVIQDYKAFDEPRFKRRGVEVEKTNRNVIQYFASLAFRAKGDQPKLTFAISHLLKCNLSKDDIKKGKAPTETVLMKCRPYLLEEIKQRKPKVIISLSTSVTKALGYKLSNYNNRGEIADNMVITVHPRILLMLRQNASGKLWGPDFFQVILRDFKKAASLARGEISTPNLKAAVERVKTQITIARSMEEVEAYCKELEENFELGKVMSYDTETTSLDPWVDTAKLLTAQFGYRLDSGLVKSIVFPLWHRENKFYDPDEAWKLISPLLSNPGYKKIGHNIKFDILYTYATTGCRVQGVLFDTMLLLHHLDSGIQGTYGLKQAVWDYLPDSELGGYENALPPLTRKAVLAKLLGLEGGESDGDNDEESEE